MVLLLQMNRPNQIPARGSGYVSGSSRRGMGLMIWQQWPLSGFWVISLFAGIDMSLNGWAWIMFALRLKRLPVRTATTLM